MAQQALKPTIPLRDAERQVREDLAAAYWTRTTRLRPFLMESNTSKQVSGLKSSIRFG